MTTIPTPSKVPLDARLTKREVEILSLVAQGHTNEEAAALLYVAPRTVGFHLTNVYAKLDVSNRVQAFRVAVRLGLLSGEPA